MKIESSVMSLAASSSQEKTHSVTEELNAWVDTQQEGRPPAAKGEGLFAVFEQAAVYSSSTEEEIVFEVSQKDKDKLMLISKLFEALAGKKLRFFIPERIKLCSNKDCAYQNPQKAQPARRRGWGLIYQRREYKEETARMDFSARGIVQTSDGKKIRIKLELSLSRRFVSEENLMIRAGDALIDPIVVNFGTPSAELTDSKFGFDIDSDGQEDNISFVKSGSGFLVLDKNGDGRINDGSELFGPSSGNGFMELRELDSDGNGWIDENDPVYDRLQIWTRDEDGNDRLFAIGQKGIGAIYLGCVESAFELRDASSALHGQIGRTGVFLREDGSPGTLQHVDLSI
jgi:hypothetical protein